MKILVTGHTGFKGSWLTLMLNELGHEVHGLSLDPLANGIFEDAKVRELCKSDLRIDIRDKSKLDDAVQAIQPNFIFHLAAQPLVLKSYEEVYETYSVNVSGTLNVLDSALQSRALKGIVVITTDKVYKNHEKQNAFIESDELGGDDPYSSSKAIADRLTQDWIRHNKAIPVGIARAGNVIGGGDVSPNRLIPDILKSIDSGSSPLIRNPNSVRPWQHVMDCLNGYLHLMDFVLEGNSDSFNFGPDEGDFHTVKEVTDYILGTFGYSEWIKDSQVHQKESAFLTLNSNKAKNQLDWENQIAFEAGLSLTVDWHKAKRAGQDMMTVAKKQASEFLNRS